MTEMTEMTETTVTGMTGTTAAVMTVIHKMIVAIDTGTTVAIDTGTIVRTVRMQALDNSVRLALAVTLRPGMQSRLLPHRFNRLCKGSWQS